jgi:hypothetical protein
MSRGLGQIERRISELFAAAKDRALSVADICDHTFELDGAIATRAQRLSATRAAHRLLREAVALDSEAEGALKQAIAETAIGGSGRGKVRTLGRALGRAMAADKLTVMQLATFRRKIPILSL